MQISPILLEKKFGIVKESMRQDLNFLLEALKAFQQDPNNQIWNEEDRKFIYKKLIDLSPFFATYIDDEGRIIPGSEKYLLKQGTALLKDKLADTVTSNPDSTGNWSELTEYFKAKQVQATNVVTEKLGQTVSTVSKRSNITNPKLQQALAEAIQETAEATAFNPNAQTLSNSFEAALKRKIEGTPELKDEILDDRKLQGFVSAIPYAAGAAVPDVNAQYAKNKQQQIQSEYEQEAESVVDEIKRQTKTEENQARTPSPDSEKAWGIKRAANKLLGGNDEEYLFRTGIITLADYEEQELKNIAKTVAAKTAAIPVTAPTEEVLNETVNAIQEQIQNSSNTRAKSYLVDQDGSLTEKGKRVAADLAGSVVNKFEENKTKAMKEDLPEFAADETLRTLDRAEEALATNLSPQVELARAASKALQKTVETLPLNATAEQFSQRYEQELNRETSDDLKAIPSEILHSVTQSAATAYNRIQRKYNTSPTFSTDPTVEKLTDTVASEVEQQLKASGEELSPTQSQSLRSRLKYAAEETLKGASLTPQLATTTADDLKTAMKYQIEDHAQQTGKAVDADKALKDSNVQSEVQTLQTTIDEFRGSNIATRQAMNAFPNQEIGASRPVITPERAPVDIYDKDDKISGGYVPGSKVISAERVTDKEIFDRGFNYRTTIEPITDARGIQGDANQLVYNSGATLSEIEKRVTDQEDATTLKQHIDERNTLKEKNNRAKTSIVNQETFLKEQAAKAAEEATKEFNDRQAAEQLDRDLQSLIEKYTSAIKAGNHDARALRGQISNLVKSYEQTQGLDPNTAAKLVNDVNVQVTNATRNLEHDYQTVEQTTKEILEKDRNFYLQNNDLVLKAYEPVQITKAIEAATQTPEVAPPQWNEMVKEIYKADDIKQLPADLQKELNDAKILQKSSYTLESIVKDYKDGVYTLEQARNEIRNAAQEQKDAYGTMIRDAHDILYGNNEAYNQSTRNQATIDKGAKVLNDQVTNLFSQILGEQELTSKNLRSQTDQELELLNSLSRKRYNALRYDEVDLQKIEKLNFRPRAELVRVLGEDAVNAMNLKTDAEFEAQLQKILPQEDFDNLKYKISSRLVEKPSFNAKAELTKVLGQQQLRADKDFELQYQLFLKDFTTSVLSTQHSADASDVPGNTRRIFFEKFNEYFPKGSAVLTEDKRRALVLQLDNQLDSITTSITRSPEIQRALTAAKTEGFITVNSKINVGELYKDLVDKNSLFYSPFKEEIGPYRLTANQIIEESVRDDFRSMLETKLRELGHGEMKAKDMAFSAIYSGFGGLTPEIDEKGKEQLGEKKIATGVVRKWNGIQKLQFEKHDEKGKRKFLESNPDETMQRMNFVIDATLETLKDRGLNKAQLQEIRKMLEENMMVQNGNKMPHTEQLLKMIGAAEKDPESAFKLATTRAFGRLPSNRVVESYIANMPFRVVHNIAHHLPIPIQSIDGFYWESIVNSRAAVKQYDIQLKRYVASFRLSGRYEEILIALESGEIPESLKDLKGLQYRGLKDLMGRKKWLNQIAQWRADHPELARLADARARFFEKDSVAFLNQIARSGDPINTSISLGANYLINSAKLKYFGKWYSKNQYTGRVQFDPLYRLQMRIRDKNAYLKEQFILKIKNSWIGQKVINGVLIPLKAWAASLLKKFLTEGVLDVISFLSGPVGWAVRGLLWLSNLPVFKQIKQLIELFFAGLVGTVIRFLWPIIGFILNPIGMISSWLGIGGTSTLAGSALSGGALGTLNFNLFAGSTFTPGLAMINPAWSGKLVSGFFNSVNGLSKGLSSLLSGSSTGSWWASLSKWAVANPMGLAAGCTIGTIACSSLIFHTSLMDALKDPLDKLTAETATALNPLQVTKTAKKADGSSADKVNNGDQIIYTIDVKSPPCANTLTLEDKIPSNAEFDPSYPPRFVPNPIPADSPIQAIQNPTAPNATNTLEWTVQIKADRVKGPCTYSSSGTSNLTDPNAATVDEIRELLRGTPLENPDMAPVIISNAQKYQINPLLMVGIFYTENGIGKSGIARPHDPSTGNGCYNLGGINNCIGGLGKQTCNTPIDPGNPWCEYTSYVDSIDANFQVVKRLIDGGTNTVEKLANKYIPVEDTRPNNTFANCPKVEPRFETNDPGNCIRPEGLNPHWKWEVAYVLAFKKLGRMTLDEYRAFNTGGGSTAGEIVNFQASFAVIAKINNVCVNNVAVAKIGDGTTTLNSSGTATSQVGDAKCSSTEPLPDGDVAFQKNFMCTHPKYKICPTVGTKYTPNSDWTKEQLAALWKIAQKVYMAEPYRSYAVGNYGIEVQRSKCYVYKGLVNCPPTGGDGKKDNTQGFNAGIDTSLSTVTLQGTKGTKVILIMNGIASLNSNPKILEYLYAHEIAHSAQHGSSSGETQNREDNPANIPVLNLKEVVSLYGAPPSFCVNGKCGSGLEFENNADAISYYMTDGEVGGNYQAWTGNTNDLKKDHLRTYNALKDGFFGGFEYDAQP